MVLQLSAQKVREGRVDPGYVRIASRSRVEQEREKTREHEREKNSVKIEENILNRVCNFVRREKVHLFPHANAR